MFSLSSLSVLLISIHWLVIIGIRSERGEGVEIITNCPAHLNQKLGAAFKMLINTSCWEGVEKKTDRYKQNRVAAISTGSNQPNGTKHSFDSIYFFPKAALSRASVVPVCSDPIC